MPSLSEIESMAILVTMNTPRLCCRSHEPSARRCRRSWASNPGTGCRRRAASPHQWPRRMSGHRRNGVIEEVRFAIDSPLEGGGFEVLVPLARAFEPFLFPSGSIARNGSFGNEGKPLGGGAAAR